jgi:hypothetical protein
LRVEGSPREGALPAYYAGALEVAKGAAGVLSRGELELAVFPDKAYRGSLMGAVIRHLQRLRLLERWEGLTVEVSELGRATVLEAGVVDLR